MSSRLRVMVEGWRFLNHSYAVSNRHYLEHLLKDRRLRVFHREMPYYRADWRAVPAVYFPPSLQAALALADAPALEPVDWTLRFDFPHRLSPPRQGKLLVFMTSEYSRLNLENIAPGMSLYKRVQPPEFGKYRAGHEPLGGCARRSGIRPHAFRLVCQGH